MAKYTFSLDPIAKACKFLICGPEGVGKSTLASKLPNPVFIDTEGSTEHMRVPRYPKPKSWAALLDMVDDAKTHVGSIQTLIIDTADWADKLCAESICERNKWDSIESAGYGKGYVMLGEEFGKLLNKMTELADMGMNVGFCAHTQLRKIEKPEESGSYDHWELKSSKRVAPLIKEWADLMLFCNFDAMVIHGATPMDKNRLVGNKRVMWCNHQAFCDAKNRFGLPDKLEMDYEPLRRIFEMAASVKAAQAQKPKPEPKPAELDKLPEVPFTGPAEGPAIDERPLPVPTPESEWTDEDREMLKPTELSDRFPELAQLMDASGIAYDEVQQIVSRKGYYPGDMPIEMYDPQFIRGCLIGAWDSVKTQILKNRKDD